MSSDPFVRTPAVFTDIGQITSEYAGRRVRIMGFVVDHQDQAGFILSDETGRISVLSEETIPQLQSFIRVFGSVAVSGEGQPLLRAEIIQDLTALDKQLYSKTRKIIEAVPRRRNS
jgi:hypothetical protein